MRKKGMLFTLVFFCFTLILVGCGEKSQESILSKLEGNLKAMEGYQANAEMTMNTGKEEQKYMVDILHKKEDHYRVELSNDSDEQGNQVILKNSEGVFVLTPALNKSFKFQADWPENGSQPYLLESLVNDIKNDVDATFTVSESHYMFQTKTNYQSNNNLPFQEIYFDKKSLTPILVKILDKDQQVLVEVKFSKFDMNAKVNEKDFEVEENMATNSPEIPVFGENSDDSFVVLLPVETAGAELKEKKEVDLQSGKRVMMTFGGEKHFTLVQEKTTEVPALSLPKEVKGEIVHLGFTVGVLSDQTIEWHHDGVDFHLASEDLTKQELIDVASSVYGREIK